MRPVGVQRSARFGEFLLGLSRRGGRQQSSRREDCSALEQVAARKSHGAPTALFHFYRNGKLSRLPLENKVGGVGAFLFEGNGELLDRFGGLGPFHVYAAELLFLIATRSPLAGRRIDAEFPGAFRGQRVQGVLSGRHICPANAEVR